MVSWAETADLLIQPEIVRSSAAAKSKSASSALVALVLVAPEYALSNLPALVYPPDVVEKAKSLALIEESQKSFVPPEQVLSAPSLNFQYPTAEPTGEPGAGCPAFMSSIICFEVRA